MNFIGRGAVYIAERLFSSSLVAVVTRDDPRTLRVCHFNKGTEITRRKFDTKILAVKLNREVGTNMNALQLLCKTKTHP